MVELLASIIAVLIFFSPLIAVIYILHKIIKHKRHKNTTKNNRTIPNTIHNSNINKQQSDAYPEQNCDDTYVENINKSNSKDDIDEYYENQHLPYRKKYLLTNRELKFYKSLKSVADEIGLVVLSKIRVADIVEVQPTTDKKFWQTYFNKINRKHIDFALAKPDDLSIVILIELDDWSHNEHQYERDRFIESVYKNTGYTLLRVKNSDDLKLKVVETIKTLN